MVKAFMCYLYTEDPNKDVLEENLISIKKILNSKGCDVYITLLNKDHTGKDEKTVFSKAFDKIDDSKFLIVLLNSDVKSEGLLMEFGYAKAKNKRIILLINNSVNKTHLKMLSDDVISFSDFNDLKNKLKEFVLE